MNLRERLARFLFADIVQSAVASAVSVRVDDSAGWVASGSGPADRAWSEQLTDLGDALEAWRKNFLIRRIVTLTRTYVLGNGITLTSQRRDVDRFLNLWWNHPKNRMARRLGPMADELTRAGELFPTLHTNPADGLSYVRFVPASRIDFVETAENDYERELRYRQRGDQLEPIWWNSPDYDQEPSAISHPPSALPPVMLHFAVNKPIGATRGDGDLTPVLKWALRYSNWLEDRVRLNRIRTKQGLLDVEIADDSMVEAKRRQLVQDDPISAGIYVHGKGEVATLHSLKIEASDAQDDGKSLRLAIAAGSNIALHYLGEGESVNYASAKEMGEPTARFYTERQTDLTGFLVDLASLAYQRYLLVTQKRAPADGDPQIVPVVTEVARADNLALAQAAKEIVAALAEMNTNGWIDDQTAITLAFKFAGEAIGVEEVQRILANRPARTPAKPPPKEREDKPPKDKP